jgi:hypothetical protein
VFFPQKKKGCKPKFTSFWRGPFNILGKLLSGDLIFRLGLLVPEPWAKSSTFTISDPTPGLMSSTTSSLSISTGSRKIRSPERYGDFVY